MKRVYTDFRFPHTELVYEGGPYFNVYRKGRLAGRFAVEPSEKSTEEYLQMCAENYFNFHADLALYLLKKESQTRPPAPTDLVLETLF